MTTQRTKEMSALAGVMLALSAMLIPVSRLNAHKTRAAEAPEAAVSTVSTDYTDENGLFNADRVHTVNILISQKDWQYMTTHATEEPYVSCDAVIDGELIEHIAIRPKGNSSLSSISRQGSTHFSYKLEFDHNDPTITYHGLDKLCLNNLGQDPGCMKDFMAYHLMNDMGVAAPLSSYALMQVNGEDFGLCLAVEAVEDSFCLRNYGEEYGMLYKPDSFSVDTLDTSAMLDYSEGSSLRINEQIMDGSYFADTVPGDRADILGTMLGSVFPPEQTAVASLRYVGGMTEDYADLWDSAVFKTGKADRVRLVNSIETLNRGSDPLSVLDADALLRYFAVHSFVNNYDSYTSLFVHNFYLHEQDGMLSMVPWDYNLAFGSFTYEAAASTVLAGSGFDPIPDTGAAMDIDTGMINYPIDTPVYSIDMADRPLLNALLTDPDMLAQYHALYDTFLTDCFENGKYAALCAEVTGMIRPYVEAGLTFYEPEQFERGAAAMAQYLDRRAAAVRGQLDGTIPATLEGQRENASGLVDPQGLVLSDMADFAALMPGLDTEMLTGVITVLLQEDFSYDTRGAVEAIHYYAAHPLKLAGRIPPLMRIPQIRQIVLTKGAPLLAAPILLIVLTAVILALHRRRRKAAAPDMEAAVVRDPFFAA